MPLRPTATAAHRPVVGRRCSVTPTRPGLRPPSQGHQRARECVRASVRVSVCVSARASVRVRVHVRRGRRHLSAVALQSARRVRRFGAESVVGRKRSCTALHCTACCDSGVQCRSLGGKRQKQTNSGNVHKL